MPVHIERIRRDIENINTFNATPHKGITRLTFSEAYQGALAYIIGQLRKIGAHITICRGGNLKGRLVGSQPQGPAVMMGSHLDTVVNGGRFDGVAGVVEVDPQGGVLEVLIEGRFGVNTRSDHRRQYDSEYQWAAFHDILQSSHCATASRVIG